ncbi:L-fucose-proton symporter [Bacteroides pyogenes]|uniref:Sugar MFS transporter n=2 Tax=Bacteroides pyogenes TaxID=310300 RepID=A0A5D3FUC6_9BACE|nr:MFS transporter [Bacteroides pyogenes]GAE22127.1 glucose/galactose transporter [Bacteroides pyogenes JCM 10003]MBB3895593.1 FHS family L-fucose permease-like MFS transporter [Bacteroides pyogenes]MBR8705193.1 L-fucose-proton symporter [Bacteroides pyogenes]MBR8707567.1 L-fucose-proton symporter [Bacteroides pyogenes]MBR8718275.1 L-fucose-proton symporter [Bacteroides pyogenes]
MDNVKKQSYLGPFITMVILMSLVGLITNINQQFQAPMQAAFLKEAIPVKDMLATFINFSFFLAYLLMGNLSANTIQKHGYRSTLVRGLIILLFAFGIFEISALLFDRFPAYIAFGESVRVPHAYFVFVLGSFVAGTALTFLQAAINPYLVACDVKGTSAVQRQTIAGAGNSTMTTIGPLLVAYVIFGGVSSEQIQISQLYIPMAVLIAIVGVLTVVLTKLNLPNVAGAASEDGAEELTESVWSFRHLALGVVAIFMYVGVEVAVGANINLYALSLKDVDGNALFTVASAAQLAALYWGGMLVGRLCGSFVSKISAQTQLLVTSVISTILVAATVVTNNPLLLVGVGLFHSIMWPAIFSLAIAKLGKYTSKGSGALMMGVVGGAILPFTQGIAAGIVGWQITWVIVVIGELYLIYYALIGHKVIKSAE